MTDLFKDANFWAAMTAVGTVCAGIGASVGVWIARSQLRELSRTAGNDGLLALFQVFDRSENRADRRRIWREISKKEPRELTEEEWDLVERTATSMDGVGTMLKHDLVRKELIFERYTEVIIPLWEALSPYVQQRRIDKGKHGWRNFEWLVGECRIWSLSNRHTDTYQRF